MNILKIATVLFLLILTSFKASCQRGYQNGYVINSSQERLEGEVKFLINKSRYKTVRFKQNGQVLQFNANDIKEYGTKDGFRFISTLIEGEFVEVLVTGEISLYKSKKGYLYTDSDQSINLLYEETSVNSLDNGVLTTQGNNLKVGLFQSMKSCSSIDSERVRELKVKEKDLVELFHEYNQCGNGESIVQKTNVQWSKVRVGINLGSTGTTVKSDIRSGIFIPVYLPLESKISSISGGLIFNFTPKRKIQNISYLIELNFYRASDKSVITSQIEGDRGSRINVTATTDYTINSISVPFLAKYSLDSWAGAFNFQGGIIMNSNNVDLNVFASSGLVPSPDIRKLQMGFMFRTGFSKSLGEGEIGIQLGYQFNPALATSEGSFRSVNRLTFSIYSLFL